MILQFLEFDFEDTYLFWNFCNFNLLVDNGMNGDV